MISRRTVLAFGLLLAAGCSIRRAPDVADSYSNDALDNATHVESRPEDVGTGVPMGYIHADGSSPFDMTDLHRGIVAPPKTSPDSEPTRSRADDLASASPSKSATAEDDEKAKNKNRRAETPANANDEKKQRRDEYVPSSPEGADDKRRR
jgi:hypothetical protein